MNRLAYSDLATHLDRIADLVAQTAQRPDVVRITPLADLKRAQSTAANRRFAAGCPARRNRRGSPLPPWSRTCSARRSSPSRPRASARQPSRGARPSEQPIQIARTTGLAGAGRSSVRRRRSQAGLAPIVSRQWSKTIRCARPRHAATLAVRRIPWCRSHRCATGLDNAALRQSARTQWVATRAHSPTLSVRRRDASFSLSKTRQRPPPRTPRTIFRPNLTIFPDSIIFIGVAGQDWGLRCGTMDKWVICIGQVIYISLSLLVGDPIRSFRRRNIVKIHLST